MRSHLRFLCALVLLALLGVASGAYAVETVTVTDVTGRTVTLPHTAQRLILAEGRQIIALSLIDRTPAAHLAGWLGDFRRNDKETYELFRKAFPRLDDIPVLGQGADGTVSVEQAIATHPDAVVLGLGIAPEGAASEIVHQLGAAGIPVVFTDFYVDPARNTLPSLRVLGAVVGRTAETEAFIGLYESHMKFVAERLAAQPAPRPSILIETHAGMAECCFSHGSGSVGTLVESAGCDSISTRQLPGPNGQISLEFVLARDPAIYIATGGAHLDARGGFVIGPGYSIATAQQRLAALMKRPGFKGLRAVRDGNVHGLFHNLLSSPLNILVVENLARWCHPSLFADLDPARTLAEINRRFLAVPLEGPYWVDLATP